MAAALIALGSNLGDRERILNDAVARSESQPGVHVVAKSQWRTTRPIGGPPGQGDFLNGAALVETSLPPQELFAALAQIETAAGRTRGERWAARTLDLDLLLYDEQIIDTPDLVVPHPRMAFRRFVLEPAAEVAPTMRHPTIGKTIEELRDHVRARSPYVAAITGIKADERTALANAVATAVAGRVIGDADPFDLDMYSVVRRFRQAANPIESLERRAQPIRMTAWTSGAFMAISDYWFEEEFFPFPGSNDGSQEYVTRYRELAAAVTEPKLLVLIDPSGIVRLPDLTSLLRVRDQALRLAREPALSESECGMLRWQISERWHGPLLRVDGTKLGEARDEVVAAIHAMQ